MKECFWKYDCLDPKYKWDISNVIATIATIDAIKELEYALVGILVKDYDDIYIKTDGRCNIWHLFFEKREAKDATLIYWKGIITDDYLHQEDSRGDICLYCYIWHYACYLYCYGVVMILKMIMESILWEHGLDILRMCGQEDMMGLAIHATN